MNKVLVLLLIAAASLFSQTVSSGGGNTTKVTWDDLITAEAATAAQVTARGGQLPSLHTFQVVEQGNPTACTIKFQSSVDGANYLDLTADLDCSTSFIHTEAGPEYAGWIKPVISTLTGTSASTVAAKAETLSEPDFATHANWATTGDFDDTGGNCTYTHSTGIGTCTQADGGFANALVASQPYTFQYTTSDITGGVIVCTVSSGCASPLPLFEASPSSPITECISSATVTDDFTITCTSTEAATISFDDLSFFQQNATNETPIKINTAAAHNLVTGDRVTITGVVGNTNANVTKNLVTVIDADTFTLDGVSGNAPWTSGGTATSAPEVTVTYAGGTQ